MSDKEKGGKVPDNSGTKGIFGIGLPLGCICWILLMIAAYVALSQPYP